MTPVEFIETLEAKLKAIPDTKVINSLETLSLTATSVGWSITVTIIGDRCKLSIDSACSTEGDYGKALWIFVQAVRRFHKGVLRAHIERFEPTVQS
jgi:hypothetical protein